MRHTKILGLFVLLTGLAACGQLTRPVPPPAAVEPALTATPLKPLSDAQQQDFIQATQLLQQGQFQAATLQLEQLWSVLPEASGIGYNLALSQWQQGESALAQHTLTELTQRNANYAAAHNLAGVLARQQGQFRQAERHFKHAIAADANYGIAHKNLAILYELYLAELLPAHYHYQQYYQLTQDQQAKIWLALIQQQLEQGDAEN